MCEEVIYEILTSLCLNHPVLEEWNITLGKPVAIICSDRAKVHFLIKRISDRGRIIDASTKVETAKKILVEANSEGVFCVVSNPNKVSSQKMQDKLAAVFSAASVGEVDGVATNAATFLVCDRIIPDELKDYVFAVHIDDVPHYSIASYDMVPPAEMLPVVRDRINQLPEDEGLAIRAAVCFTYPYFEKMGDNEGYLQMHAEAKELIKNAELYAEQDDIADVAANLIRTFLVDNGDYIINISDMDGMSEEDLEHFVFWDRLKLYISDGKFKEMVAPLLEISKVDVIKHQLHSRGILEGNIGNYTVKMTCQVNGVVIRPRMLRIDLKKLQEFAGTIY